MHSPLLNSICITLGFSHACSRCQPIFFRNTLYSLGGISHAFVRIFPLGSLVPSSLVRSPISFQMRYTVRYFIFLVRREPPLF